MINYALWDLKEEFTVVEAACLWFDVDPSEHPWFESTPEKTERDIELMMSILKDAVRKGSFLREHRLESYWDETASYDDPISHRLYLSKKGLKAFAESIGQAPLFLFQEERGKSEKDEGGPEPKPANAPPEKDPPFKHSDDYRSIALNGENFTLTPQQARVIEILHRAHERGTPEIGKDFILEEIESTSNRLRDIFRSSPEAWKTLIAKGGKQGTYRLNI